MQMSPLAHQLAILPQEEEKGSKRSKSARADNIYVFCRRDIFHPQNRLKVHPGWIPRKEAPLRYTSMAPHLGFRHLTNVFPVRKVSSRILILSDVAFFRFIRKLLRRAADTFCSEDSVTQLSNVLHVTRHAYSTRESFSRLKFPGWIFTPLPRPAWSASHQPALTPHALQHYESH